MPIIASNRPNRKSASIVEEGIYPAVCTAVTDLGECPSNYGPKHKVEFEWTLADRTEKVTRRYTLSLSERSALRQDIQSWMGRPLSRNELQGLDLESLVGKPCVLHIVPQEGDYVTWARVLSVHEPNVHATV